ncbi:MAG: ABC transporter ATP-binding protein [Candidatus Dormibacteraceae bacterium]
MSGGVLEDVKAGPQAGSGRLLDVCAVTKSFGGVQALDSCSFKVAPHRITALIGPNGSGKTTIFNCVSGFYRPDAGEVRFGERRISGLAPSRIVHERLARTFQITRIFKRMSVLENMVVPVRRTGLKAMFWDGIQGHERERAERLLEFVGLLRFSDEQAGHLSFGQQKLLELAAALMAEPEILLLDEPSGGLNPVMIDRLAGYVVELNQMGTTFLIVEHNMGFVMRLADTVVVMHRGAVIGEGTAAEVRADPRVLEAYLGD